MTPNYRKKFTIVNLTICILLCLYQFLSIHPILVSPLINDNLQSPQLAKCDLPTIFQDVTLLQTYRSKRYPGSITFDSYIVGFPHLFKVGGTSMKSMLRDQAKKAHIDVRCLPFCKRFCTNGDSTSLNKCFEHPNLMSKEHPDVMSRKGLQYKKKYMKTQQRKLNTECLNEILDTKRGVFYGHTTYAAIEELKKKTQQNVYIGLFREPSARWESLFRFNNQNRHTVVTQDTFQDFLKKNANVHTVDYLSRNAPIQLFSKIGKPSLGEAWDTTEWKLTFPTKQKQCHALEEVLQNILENYAVVGVLERVDDVMEVLRCRFPWFQANATHHKNPTGNTWKDVPLNNTKGDLMNLITPMEDVLFDVANRILTADLKNCRGL